jgi:diguanylate cyclase (GGDEF)-like protein
MRLTAWEKRLTRPTRFLRIESLRERMLLFAVLAALVPALVVTWVSYIQNKGAVSERLARQLEGVAGQATREVELWRKDHLYNLRVFTGSYEVLENLERAGRGQRLTNFLTSLRERIPDYAALAVLDAEGRILAATPSADVAAPPTLPDDWGTAVRADEPFVGEPQWDERLAVPAVTLVVPIRPATRVMGALAATARLEPLHRTLQSLAPTGGGRVLLLTQDGRVLLGPDSTTAELMRARLPAARGIRGATGGILEYTSVDGTPVVGSFRRVPGVPWTIATELPEAEAYRQLASLRTAALLIVGGLVVGVGLIAYFLGLLLVRPLDRLAEGAAQVAKGDFAVELPVLGGGEVGALTQVFNDMVVQLREGREALERLSVTDSLTSLFNRRRLMELLGAEVRRSQRLSHRFAVLMLDVDQFKTYNDAHGHLAGDHVLVRVAELMRESVREVDVVARYGGEEFVVLMPEAGPQDAATVAERVRRRIAEERFPHRTVTVSLGVAHYPANGDSAEAVIAAADAALYQAKRAGRNRVASAGRPPADRRVGS